MENYYFINSVDTKNQTMNIQEVGKGEMSAQQVRVTQNDADVYSLMLGEATQEGERMGLTRMPPIHSTYSLLDQDIPEIKHSSFVQENQQFKQEFLYFHHLFSLGLTAISHPYKPEITDRRRKIFLMRFVYGLSINHVSDRIHYQKNVIVDDSQSSLLQFANALSILVLKEQEISA